MINFHNIANIKHLNAVRIRLSENIMNKLLVFRGYLKNFRGCVPIVTTYANEPLLYTKLLSVNTAVKPFSMFSIVRRLPSVSVTS